MLILPPLNFTGGLRPEWIQPSDYFDYYLKQFGPDAVVEARQEADGTFLNVEEIMPHTAKVFPSVLTIYTHQLQDRSHNRLNQQAIYPSEHAFFVYAFNAKGQLIKPLAKKPNDKPNRFQICTYEFDAISAYWGEERQFVPKQNKRTDLPILLFRDNSPIPSDGYDSNRPDSNPPHGRTIIAQTEGEYSVSIFVRNIANDARPDRIPQKKEVTTEMRVIVKSGSEYVDSLGLTASIAGKLSLMPGTDTSDATYVLNLKPGEDVELRAVGICERKKWNLSSNKYEPDISTVTTIPKLHWSYDAKHADDIDAIEISTTNGTGTIVMIRGKKVLKGNHCAMRIFGMGKTWPMKVRVTA